MIAYERTDYLASLDAGTLLLKASTAANFVVYESKDKGVLKFLPYLSANHSLCPAEEALGDEYPLLEFNRMARDLERLTGSPCEEEVLRLWTFAYYTGWHGFSSKDVYLSTDGVDFQMPPLFNYSGAFNTPCDYEAIKPPRRAFQCYWHYVRQRAAKLYERPPYLDRALAHFTQAEFYR